MNRLLLICPCCGCSAESKRTEQDPVDAVRCIIECLCCTSAEPEARYYDEDGDEIPSTELDVVIESA